MLYVGMGHFLLVMPSSCVMTRETLFSHHTRIGHVGDTHMTHAMTGLIHISDVV